jgi:nicotinate-nucleotide adenylyltransferase
LRVSRAIGIFGGSFDPVHNAHLRIARAALEALGLAALRWLPNSQPGHRESPRAPAAARLEMLKIALRNEPRFEVDESELWRVEPTYTVETLARFRQALGDSTPFVFIIGADHLMGLHTWKRWRDLFALTHLAVAERPGHDIREAAMTAEVATEYRARTIGNAAIEERPAGGITRFACPPLDISSSAIRERLSRGAPVFDLLPPPVLAYIESHQLYRTPKDKDPH